MNESLDKLLECEYACDFCSLEIPAKVKYRNEQRIKRKEQPFFKKIFDPYIEVVPRTTPKSWIIRKIEHSEAGKLTLLKYLESTDNYFITAKQYDVLLNKHYVYLCDHHIYSLGGCPRIENLLRKSYFGHIFRSFSFNRTTIRLK